MKSFASVLSVLTMLATSVQAHSPTDPHDDSETAPEQAEPEREPAPKDIPVNPAAEAPAAEGPPAPEPCEVATEEKPATDREKHLDPRTAILLASAGTVAGLSTLAVGMATDNENVALIGALTGTLAPTSGHVYAKEPIKGILHAAIRGTGLSLFALGRGFQGDASKLEKSLSLAGAGLVVGSTAYAIIDAPSSERPKTKKTLQISPTAIRGPLRSKALGLGLAAKF